VRLGSLDELPENDIQGTNGHLSNVSFETIKKSKKAIKLNYSTSSVSREILRGVESDSYNPFIAEYSHLQQGRYQSLFLKVITEVWALIRLLLELR
jgi:hypothetical protein